MRCFVDQKSLTDDQCGRIRLYIMKDNVNLLEGNKDPWREEVKHNAKIH